MKGNCFSVWQRRGPKLVPASACLLATFTTMLGIPGISTAQKLQQPFTPKYPHQGHKIGTLFTAQMPSLHDNLSSLKGTCTYCMLGSHLNMAATVSDLSCSAMLTPRPVSCSAWYNFASSVWDSSGWAKVGGRVRAKARARGVYIHTQTPPKTHTHLTNFNTLLWV